MSTLTITGDTITTSFTTNEPALTLTLAVTDPAVSVSLELLTTDYVRNNDWFGLASGYATFSGPTSITGGRVYTYTYLGAVTRYRFISTDNATDAFYTTFDGTNLTGLVATKALSF